MSASPSDGWARPQTLPIAPRSGQGRRQSDPTVGSNALTSKHVQPAGRAGAFFFLMAMGGCVGPAEDDLEHSEQAVSSGWVELWTDANFSGTRMVVHGDLDFNFLNGTPKGNLNDKISSVKVFNGASIKLYADAQFAGGFLDVSQNISNLGDFGFNDKASALSWGSTASMGAGFTCADFTSHCVEIYSDANFLGSRFTIFGDLDINDLWSMGWNDAISSVRVFNGAWLRLCTDHGWSGGCIDITSDVSYLGNFGFNDRASSLAFQPVVATDF